MVVPMSNTLASPTKALRPISIGPVWMKLDCAR